MAKSKKKIETLAEVVKDASKDCQKAKDKVDALLLRKCKSKFHHLSPCCKCSPKSKGPRIRTQNDGILLNTAYNGSGGTVTPPGPDFFWEYSNSLSGPWVLAPVSGNPIPGAWSGTAPANADWLSSVASAKPGGKKNAYFRLKFVLCEGINPHDFKTKVNYLVDDTLKEIYVNGVPQSGKTSIPSGGFKNQSSAKLEDDWKHCENEIIFHVNSTQTYLGFIAGFSIGKLPVRDLTCKCECKEAKLPEYAPCFSVSWGDSKKDEFSTNDCEVICITACNCYCNLTFEDLTIHHITLCDEKGNPIPTLPGGTPSVEVIPFGPVCFGDLGPCKPGKTGNCISRQVAIRTRGAKPGYYQLKLDAICYKVAYVRSTETCFEFELVKD